MHPKMIFTCSLEDWFDPCHCLVSTLFESPSVGSTVGRSVARKFKLFNQPLTTSIFSNSSIKARRLGCRHTFGPLCQWSWKYYAGPNAAGDANLWTPNAGNRPIDLYCRPVHVWRDLPATCPEMCALLQIVLKGSKQARMGDRWKRPFETHSDQIESRMFGTAIEMSDRAVVDDE